MALRVLNRRGQTKQTVDVSSPSLVGVLGLWPDSTPPDGWLVCDGSVFSGATYPALAATLGGTTLPDMRGRTPIGQGTHADVAALGANDLLAVGSRTPGHGHVAGSTTHQHGIAHSHAAVAHTHTTSGSHNHTSQGHTHGGRNHSHDVAGQAANTTQGVSADGVPSGTGTDTRNLSHDHGPGSLLGDTNNFGTVSGYNNAVNGGFTSGVTPGNTGSDAPAAHTGGATMADPSVTSAASDTPVPYLALVWIIKAA